jgi:hypothetical protein
MATGEGLAALDPEVVASTAAGLRRWISSEACQRPTGAIAAWYDLDASRRSYDYPEIGGYALTFLAGQAALSKRESAAGRRCAEWLVARVRARNFAARDRWDNDAIYLFDLGMIASGLLSFGRRVQDSRFIAAGLELVGFVGDETGSVSSISPISARGHHSERRTWSSRGRAHLAKIVQAFLFANEFNIGAERGHPELLIESVKSLQADDGRIQTDPDQTTTMLHPHLYAAEGLWIWGSARGEDDSLERAWAAVQWVWSQQLESGGFPRSVPDPPRGGLTDEQSDVTAQAVRLALVLGLRSPAVDRAVARMIELTREHKEALGIVYQPGSRDVHLNTWATLFAAQALNVAIPNSPLISWRQLV